MDELEVDRIIDKIVEVGAISADVAWLTAPSDGSDAQRMRLACAAFLKAAVRNRLVALNDETDWPEFIYS